MRNFERSALSLFALAGLLAGCSGMGTTMTKVGRLGQNKGYEIAAELPVVQAASMQVLKTRGFDPSVKADPESGAEGAGQIIIGHREARYSAKAGAAVGSSKQMDTRELINVNLSKKWKMSDNLAVPNITLVEIVGSSYLRKSPGEPEVETPFTKAYIALLRDEIERAVTASRSVKPVVQ